MFIVSQYILRLMNVKSINKEITYSIILGLIFYTSLYLYILYYKEDFLNIFNKFIVYIVIGDLMLTTLYIYLSKNSKNQSSKLLNDLDTFEKENSKLEINSDDSEELEDELEDDLEDLDELEDDLEEDDELDELEDEEELDEKLEELVEELELDEKLQEDLKNEETELEMELEQKYNKDLEKELIEYNKVHVKNETLENEKHVNDNDNIQKIVTEKKESEEKEKQMEDIEENEESEKINIDDLIPLGSNLGPLAKTPKKKYNRKKKVSMELEL